MFTYEVWLLGDTKDGDATDFDQFIEEFKTKEEAFEFADTINSLSEICKQNPIGKENVAFVRLVVEECEVHYEADDSEEIAETVCVDTPYEREIEWISKRRNYKCPRCGGQLFVSQINGYYAQCFKCDEDFYRFECAKK